MLAVRGIMPGMSPQVLSCRVLVAAAVPDVAKM